METTLQQPVIGFTKPVETRLETTLEANQRISTFDVFLSRLLAPEQILRHRRNDGARKEIGSQHGEDNRLRQRQEQVPRYA